MDHYTILDHHWRSALHSVCFVAYATNNPDNPGEWNSVVGYRPDQINILYDDEDDVRHALPMTIGTDENTDLQYVAAHGAKLEWQIAKVMFKKLDITKHKYYEN